MQKHILIAILITSTAACSQPIAQLHYTFRAGSIPISITDIDQNSPKDINRPVSIGQETGVTRTRKQVSIANCPNKTWLRETIEITLTNNTGKPVEILAREEMYRSPFWEITSSTHEPSHSKMPYPREVITEIDSEWEEILANNAKSKIISFNFQNAPLNEVVAQLSELTNTKIKTVIWSCDCDNGCGHSEPPPPNISWQAEDAPLIPAIYSMLRAHELLIGVPKEAQPETELIITNYAGPLKGYCFPQGNIRPRWATHIIDNSAVETISFDFKEKPLKECLEIIFKKIGLKFRYATDYNLNWPITLKVANMPVEKTLPWILRQAELTCELKDNTILIRYPHRLRSSVWHKKYQIPPYSYSPKEIIELVQKLIEPKDWADELGTGIWAEGNTITVMQSLYVFKRVDFFITALLSAYDKRFVEFTINIPPNSSEKITYTVVYTLY